jgi:hypothetical protein
VDLSGLFTDIELESLLTEIPILDDGEFAEFHQRGVAGNLDAIVVGFGKFAAPIDADCAGGAVRAVQERWGKEPEIALVSLCQYLEDTLSGSQE